MFGLLISSDLDNIGIIVESLTRGLMRGEVGGRVLSSWLVGQMNGMSGIGAPDSGLF